MSFPDNPVQQTNGISMTSGTKATVLSLATAIIIPHGLGKTPAFASANAATIASAVQFQTLWDKDNIYVNLTVPMTGTMTLNWMAIG